MTDKLQKPFTPGTQINNETVTAFEQFYATTSPRSPEQDALLLEYFLYLNTQLDLVEKPLPVIVYNRDITSEAKRQEVTIAIGLAVITAVHNRGRGHNGMLGSYFWNDAEELAEMYFKLGKKSWQIASRIGITEDTWFNQVSNPVKK